MEPGQHVAPRGREAVQIESWVAPRHKASPALEIDRNEAAGISCAVHVALRVTGTSWY
jgi:hypothetical protein